MAGAWDAPEVAQRRMSCEQRCQVPDCKGFTIDSDPLEFI